MKIRPASEYQVRAAHRAEKALQEALVCAKVAGCPKLVPKIRKALKSAGGAVRHVHHRRNRTDATGRAIDSRGRVYGVLHVTNTDRRQFAHVESPPRPLWWQKGQYA